MSKENTFGLKVRRIVEKDWDFLPDWWKAYPAWKGESVPREMLPGRYEAKMPSDLTKEEEASLGMSGYIVHKDETPIAAAWLTLTNSKRCHVAPVVANPDYRDTDRKEALKLLIHFTTHVGYDLGFEYAHCWSDHDGLSDIYSDIGYTMSQGKEGAIKL